MMKKLMMSLLGMVCAAGMAQTDETLFTSPFTSDYDKSMPYRIPAIVQTSNDEILVIADKRHGGCDVGQYTTEFLASLRGLNGHVDLVYRRWNGKKWSNETTIITGNKTFGYGDAAVVADREDPSKILIMCAAGNVFFTKSENSDGKRLQCYRFRSTNGGADWDSGTDVSKEIYNTTLGGSYAGAFFSSGRICQSSQIKVGDYYRLYAALCVTGTNSVVVYSDDFGDTWAMLGSVAVAGGNEAKCEELPNGSVLVSSRNGDGRFYRVYNYSDSDNTYTSGSWEESTHTVLSGKDGSATNGEVLIVPAVDKDGNTCNILLQSLPAESGRKKVTIYWQKLSSNEITTASKFTGDWGSYQVSSTESAYSSMIWQADGNIGFVLEDEYKDYGKGGYHIKYKNLPLSTITGGAYTNIQPKTMSQVPASCTASWCNNASYSTLYLPYGVELPEGVTAYTGTLEGNVLTIKAIESGVVPAYTAVLLEDTEKRSTINLTMVNTTAEITENDLQGTLTAIDDIDNSKYYVLGHGSSHIGFYHPNSTTLKANAAYIYVEDGAAALSIRREGATDIEEEEVAIDNEQSAIIYDLMGRRVENPTRGLYIINGKKVFVK